MSRNEQQTRFSLVDPAIRARGWTEDLVRVEETAGTVEIIDGRPRKQPKGRVDYLLRVKPTPKAQPVPVALIEAKAEHLPPHHGLEQAKAYARCKLFHVPFVYATNGHLFVEFDGASGLTTDPSPLADFPTPDDLRARYEAAVGFGLAEEVAAPLLQPYPKGEASRRYYQDAAIRATLEKIARCGKAGEPKRALLSLATGSGKTRIAVYLLKRIADAGQLRRALFVCDRDELRTQAVAALQNVFGDDAAPVSSGEPQKNARLLVATYQTLDVASDDADATFLTTNYPPDYFSHIVIDECHRSAWGKWSLILRRNPSAVQIGLTATPRELKVTERTKAAEADEQINRDNLKHFGEPVYEYDLGQGIEDGYLAACEVVKRDIFIAEHNEPEHETGVVRDDLEGKRLIDARTGEVLTAQEAADYYSADSFESRLLLPARVQAMCEDLFRCLLATGGLHQKTVIFCVRDSHADRVASCLGNLYTAWCAEHGEKRQEPYAFKCTAASEGSAPLADLRKQSRSHFIAATVDLLSTGVDVPCLRNVVFFRYMRSPLAFHQMVGRGTRLDPPSGKLMFRVYDYTDASRLFGQEFVSPVPAPEKEPGPRPEPVQTLEVRGIQVHITPAGQSIMVQRDGQPALVTLEEYKELLTERLLAEAPTLETFRQRWVVPPDRRAWLAGLPAETAATLRALAAQFARGGTESLENPRVFDTADVRAAGGLEALKGLGEPASVLSNTKQRMFAV